VPFVGTDQHQTPMILRIHPMDNGPRHVADRVTNDTGEADA
jgi:hypothetical protein